jgi:hypothetical protein
MMSLALLFLLISAATANTSATNTTTQPIVTRTFYQSVRTSQNAWPELMCSSKPECPSQVVCHGSLSDLKSWSCSYSNKESANAHFTVSLEYMTSDLRVENLKLWVSNTPPVKWWETMGAILIVASSFIIILFFLQELYLEDLLCFFFAACVVAALPSPRNNRGR